MSAMKTKMTATRAYNEVARSAEKIKNGDPATIEVMEPGDVLRQGDIYITRLRQPLSLARSSPWAGRQLAVGTTQGSRHVAEGPCELYTPSEEDAAAALSELVPATRAYRHFFGPAIVASGPITITHPEHGHRTIPAGAYLVTYQRVWAQEIRRVAD